MPRNYGQRAARDRWGYDDPHCWSPWGTYWNGYSWSFSFGNCWNSFWNPCYSWWWPCYSSYWWPCWYYGWYRPYYSCYGPVAYSTAVYYVDDDPDVVYVDAPAASAPVGEAAAAPAAPEAAGAAGPLPAAAKSSLSIAAERYLQLGDRSFHAARYSEAVQFYAKAVEFATGEGALYLVLADALFAAGDFHYAAYALRKAHEIEPGLFEAVIDKHAFYADPAEFDRHLAALERFLVDHQSDADARLVLAVNDLFGKRPAAAVDLLSAPESAALGADPLARAVLASARAIQYGE